MANSTHGPFEFEDVTRWGPERRLIDCYKLNTRTSERGHSQVSSESEDGSHAIIEAHDSISMASLRWPETQHEYRSSSLGGHILPSTPATDEKVRRVLDPSQHLRWNGIPLYYLTWELLGILISTCFLSKYHPALLALITALGYTSLQLYSY
jgi:hypothetical protein